MSADLGHLPVTIAPAPGEALDGYLERLAAANAMPHPLLVQHLTRHGARSAFLTLAPDPRLIANLAAMTGQPADDLRYLTLSFVPGIDVGGLDPTDEGTWRVVAARGWPPSHGSALCPRCLDQHGTWQLRWRHPWVTACVEHSRRLIGHCPSCGKRFRSHRTPLRSVDAAADRCENPRGTRGPGCRQLLRDLDADQAPYDVLVTQRRIDAALQGSPVSVLGDQVDPGDYLGELKALTVLLLHLSLQPHGDRLAGWAGLAHLDHARSLGHRGARWALAPPADLMLRGQALASADEILGQPTLEQSADALHPWTALTPVTTDGQLGWLADHTTMTPLLSRLIMNATAARRRLATLLDASPSGVPLTAIPQVIPADLYASHLTGMLDVADRTGRLFAALCLAREHNAKATWPMAARALGLPGDLGAKTARACSADLLVPAHQLVAAIAQLATNLDTAVDYRARENGVRRLARRRGWYRPWARIHLPGSHDTSQQYAITWLWTEHAHGHVDTSPGWTDPPGHRDRARQRAYTARLDPAAKDALIALAQRTPAETRRTA